MNDNKHYWYFIRKVNEKLTILFQHKIPNHMDVDETDEQLLKELYEMFSQSELFMPTDEELAEAEQLHSERVTENKSGLFFVSKE